MKITIPMKHSDGKIEFIEVDASLPFEMFGFTFAAHRRVIPGLPADKSDGWRVTEISSGASVRWGDTRTHAIRNAKETLERVGPDRLTKEVKKQLRRQKKAGRKP